MNKKKIKMTIDSAWIFRICLITTVLVILFADFLGPTGANARKNDQNDNNNNDDKYLIEKGA